MTLTATPPNLAPSRPRQAAACFTASASTTSSMGISNPVSSATPRNEARQLQPVVGVTYADKGFGAERVPAPDVNHRLVLDHDAVLVKGPPHHPFCDHAFDGRGA